MHILPPDRFHFGQALQIDPGFCRVHVHKEYGVAVQQAPLPSPTGVSWLCLPWTCFPWPLDPSSGSLQWPSRSLRAEPGSQDAEHRKHGQNQYIQQFEGLGASQTENFPLCKTGNQRRGGDAGQDGDSLWTVVNLAILRRRDDPNLICNRSERSDYTQGLLRLVGIQFEQMVLSLG